jgi:4-amino-4-deoxychorismate lyase
MSLLVETIRTEEGRLMNIGFHNERMIRSLSGLFGLRKEINLEEIVAVPEVAHKGLFKCRVVYDRKIRKIEFLPYQIRKVRSLKMVEDNKIEYHYKFSDRTVFEKLMTERGECDDIIIIKNGLVTDSSYANLIFRDYSGNWFTPFSCLLKGTRRASLIRTNRIKEVPIPVSDLRNYSKVKLINAMIGIDDTEGIPVNLIM